MKSLPLTVVIPTYRREQVLLETIEQLLAQSPAAAEILILDQTPAPPPGVAAKLQSWHDVGGIRWVRGLEPSQPGALNAALGLAAEDWVLFLDDDIRIEPGFLKSHLDGFCGDEIWAVAGQVLQPGEVPDAGYRHEKQTGAFADFDFRFRSDVRTLIENGMSGNLCVRKSKAMAIGGFDENFIPPVAYRFDNDFCKRLCRAGGQIAFEPAARIYHLRANRGGTRSQGSHLTSASPIHGVGDYYFAMRNSRGLERFKYIAGRFFREVRTRFHLKHPWWIPVKMLGELRAIGLAMRLNRKGPSLLGTGSISPPLCRASIGERTPTTLQS